MHSHSINANVYVLRGSTANLFRISLLRQFVLNDDNDVWRNEESAFAILGNNDKILKCKAIVDVDAVSMYTNAVSTGTGGKESDVIASRSDFTATTSKGEVDKDAYAPRASA